MQRMKIKYFIPTAVLFLSPWMHKMIYLNILAAWPNTYSGAAHVIGMGGALVALMATATMMMDD